MWTTDHTCGRREAVDEHCEQPEGRPNRPVIKMLELHTKRSSKLDSHCCVPHDIKLRDDTCTDFIYTRWSTFATASCDNADVVNCCVSSSSSLSPSPPPAGECDRCAYLVGEQCSGLSGKPCMDCTFSNRFSWVSMGCKIPGSRVGQDVWF